jgi:glutathione S-transferase
MTGSDFWRQGKAEPDMIRWISRGKENFVRAYDMAQFERGMKRRYNLGPTDPASVEQGFAGFHEAAAILNAHLETHDWLTGTTPGHADFRMASFLPFNDAMRLPLADYPALAHWEARLNEIPAWGRSVPGPRRSCPSSGPARLISLALAPAPPLGQHGVQLRPRLP